MQREGSGCSQDEHATREKDTISLNLDRARINIPQALGEMFGNEAPSNSTSNNRVPVGLATTWRIAAQTPTVYRTGGS
jgi:hypothetical protein